ncbi:DEAD/DEAH box helicase [Catenulispora sp. GAS73]|uniref:DEAD/DEAH box helicase n=1 Tax=Catenulispora sp. GAS73 TaxID=3156269 RepID=UPI0035168152
MFTPPPIRDEPSWDKKVFKLDINEVPPWHPDHPLARIRIDPGKVWQHTVYGGVFGLERLRDVIVSVFGDDARYRDERLTGSSAVFAVSLNASGRLIDGSEVLSACGWAVGNTLTVGPRRRAWLSSVDWDTACEQFAERTAALGGPAIPGLAESEANDLTGRIRSAAANAASTGVTAIATPAATSIAGPLVGGAVGKAAGVFAKNVIEPGGSDSMDDFDKWMSGEEEEEAPDKRRPLTVFDLLELLDEQCELLDIAEALAPSEIWVASKLVHRKSEESADNDFLNSFILRDLERVHGVLAKGDTTATLKAFLRPVSAIDFHSRVDVRQDPYTVLAEAVPENTPEGRWVTNAEHALALSQQFAVNRLLDPATERSVPVFAVNGPPGTGKTTMLRDVIAALVVERATRLAALTTPQSAFAGPTLTWSTESWRRSVRPLRPELTGFEIVVACAGNGAAKNITHEFPGPDGIDAAWREDARDVGYFADAASIVLGLEEVEPDKQAWAAVAAALGKMSLRREFSERFWWGVTAKEEVAAERERRKKVPTGFGLGDILSQQNKNGERIDWKAAVARFKAAKGAVDALTAARQSAADAAATIGEHDSRLANLHHAISQLDEEIELARPGVGQAKIDAQLAQADLNNLIELRDRHLQAQPKLWITISTRGKAGRTWYDQDQALVVGIHNADAVHESKRTAARVATGRYAELHRRRNDLVDQHANASVQLGQAEARWKSALEHWPGYVPTADVMADDRRRELLAPWNDPEIAAARTHLFLEALRLHKQFLLATAGTMRQNLQAAFDLVTGNGPPDIAAATAKAAWQSLFLAVPVVSTTFASMGRLFSHLGSEDLGWLFIDEAGQATPQNAVGALWRAKRAVIVGDPLQLEPVVTIPHTLQQALREHFGVAKEWLPGWTSVQTVADRLAPHGTYLEIATRDGSAEQTWVGAPLRVHRRCDDPMFTISNDIAYGGELMVNGKPPIAPEKDPYLGLQGSRWVDVQAAAAGKSSWIPEEGEKLREIVGYLRRRGVDLSRVRVITPFCDVRDGVKALKLGLTVNDSVGTIHTMQGKEADIVFLMLGGGNQGQRAWAAEKPNLLNVAVSRAKRRLYVIGDRDQWMKLRYFSTLAAQLPESPKTNQARNN